MGKVCAICGMVMMFTAVSVYHMNRDIALILNEGVKFICLIAIVSEVLKK